MTRIPLGSGVGVVVVAVVVVVGVAVVGVGAVVGSGKIYITDFQPQMKN